jgi:hypothetical protein
MSSYHTLLSRFLRSPAEIEMNTIEVQSIDSCNPYGPSYSYVAGLCLEPLLARHAPISRLMRTMSVSSAFNLNRMEYAHFIHVQHWMKLSLGLAHMGMQQLGIGTLANFEIG